MKPDTPPILLTYQEAAKLLGVSDRTVWQLVADGKIPAVRFAARTVRIDRQDIDKFIEAAKDGKGVQP